MMHAPVDRPFDQTSPFQNLEMLRHRRQGHGERHRQLSHHRRPAKQPRQHGPARPVGQRMEHLVEPFLDVGGNR